MNLKHPSLSKIVIVHDSHFDSPSLFAFRKEEHTLAISKSFLDLYRQCVKMGYEIKDVPVEHKSILTIKEYLSRESSFKLHDRLFRKYTYQLGEDK